MQDIENDMDDLFRRAAENYPLNTSKSDWEKIDKKLPLPAIDEEIKKPAKRFNYKKLLFLLLLMLSSIAIIFIFKSSPDKNLANSNLVRNKEQSVSPKKTRNPYASVIQSPTTNKTKSKKFIELKNEELKKVAMLDKSNNDGTNNTSNFNENTISKDEKFFYSEVNLLQAEKHDRIFNVESKTKNLMSSKRIII